MFDMPYFLNRLALNNIDIPNISKVVSLKPWVFNRSYPTPFGREIDRTINIPGTEILDLIHFYRRFYPHLSNHKLDTISKFFVGNGKTGLTIDEMMDAIKSNDPNKLAKVVDYSFVDSLRMYELWESCNIQDSIEHVCNNLGISADTLLRFNFKNIIDRAVYNIDPGTCFVKSKCCSPNHTKDAIKGIYKNIYVYDYSELYRHLMLSSNQPIASVLGNRLESAPPKLITTAFYSTHVNRDDLLSLLDAMLQSLDTGDNIISIEPFIIRSKGPLTSGWLKLIGNYPCYVSVSKASYIVLDDIGELETSGLSKLCRPKFKLSYDVIKTYLSLVYSGNLETFAIPIINNIPLDKFILTERIGDVSSLSPSSIKYKLFIQHGDSIETWISVNYVMTVNGPILVHKLTETDLIDYKYYFDELNKYIKDLKSLSIVTN
jgi:hypothetical protein